MGNYYVLMENEHEPNDAVLVVIEAESLLAVQQWARDCDRGMWTPVAATDAAPKIMTLTAFEDYAVAHDEGKWYTRTPEDWFASA